VIILLTLLLLHTRGNLIAFPCERIPEAALGTLLLGLNNRFLDTLTQLSVPIVSLLAGLFFTFLDACPYNGIPVITLRT